MGPEDMLDRLHALLNQEFPSVFPASHDPSYRYIQHHHVRYCWNTTPMRETGKAWATWKERQFRVRGAKNVWRLRRYQIVWFTKRKTAKKHAVNRYRKAKSLTAQPSETP